MGAKDRWPGIWRSGTPKTKEAGAARRHGSLHMTRVALASAAAVAVALGAGAASASIRGPHSKIPGCYSTLTGRLKNVEGQPGAGCHNAKHLYIADFSNVAVSFPATVVAVLNHVPAGAYLVSVTGQGTVAPNSTDNSETPQLTCSLTPSTTSYVPDTLPIGNPPNGSYSASIVAEGDSVLTTAGKITFSCQAEQLGPSIPTLQGVITAVPVGGVN